MESKINESIYHSSSNMMMMLVMINNPNLNCIGLYCSNYQIYIGDNSPIMILIMMVMINQSLFNNIYIFAK